MFGDLVLVLMHMSSFNHGNLNKTAIKHDETVHFLLHSLIENL